MIYFLVNNNYHVIDFEKHFEEIKKKSNENVALIQVPHTLKMKTDNKDYKTFLFSRISDDIKLLLPFNYYKVIKSVDSAIKPTSEDILFIYTEYELLNHYIVSYFKKNKAKVFLIEEGLATYMDFCFIQDEKTKFKKILLEKYIQIVLGMKNSRLSKSNKRSFSLKDSLFDGVLLYFDVKIVRHIKSYIIKRQAIKLENLDSKKVIFLNEDIYSYYDEFDSYLSTLTEMLNSLSKKFNKVYFKFHPREYNMQKNINRITEQLNKIGGIEIIQDKEPIEISIEKLKPKFVVSYLSVALMNLFFMGLEPIYVYYAIDNLKNHQPFINVTKLLKLLNYHFIEDFKDIESNYSSNINYDDSKTISIIELLKK